MLVAFYRLLELNPDTIWIIWCLNFPSDYFFNLLTHLFTNAYKF
jgi:hypothetical protein